VADCVDVSKIMDVSVIMDAVVVLERMTEGAFMPCFFYHRVCCVLERRLSALLKILSKIVLMSTYNLSEPLLTLGLRFVLSAAAQSLVFKDNYCVPKVDPSHFPSSSFQIFLLRCSMVASLHLLIIVLLALATPTHSAVSTATKECQTGTPSATQLSTSQACSITS
jgi:hypothetical protein